MGGDTVLTEDTMPPKLKLSENAVWHELRGMSSGVRLMGLICLLVHFLSVYQGPTLCRCLASAQDGADLLPALRSRCLVRKLEF